MSLPMGRIMSGTTTTNPLRDLRCLNGHEHVDSEADSGSGAGSFFKNNGGQDFESSADADKVTENPVHPRGKWEANADSGFGDGIELGEVAEQQALHTDGETKSE